jgi:hypothetical protein
MSDDTVLVCRRVADMPTPPLDSVRVLCALCFEPVWQARSSPDNYPVWCFNCAADEIAAAPKAEIEIVRPIEAQLADLAAHFNRRRDA